MSDKRLEEMAEDAAAEWLCRSSITFLETALHLMLTHLSKEAVIEVLKAELQMMEDLD